MGLCGDWNSLCFLRAYNCLCLSFRITVEARLEVKAMAVFVEMVLSGLGSDIEMAVLKGDRND